MLDWASGMTEAQFLEVMCDRVTDAGGTEAPEGAGTMDASETAQGATQSEGGEPVRGMGSFSRLRSLFGAGSGGECAKELRALAQSKYPFYHRCIGLGLFTLMEQCDAAPRLAAISRWAAALGIKESKLRKDYEWQFDALERIMEAEERRLEDDVRKLQDRADALTREAEAAQREADEAEGIVPPVTPTDAPSQGATADQAAAAAELGEALADVVGLGPPAGTETSGGDAKAD